MNGDWKLLTTHLVSDGRQEIELTDDHLQSITNSTSDLRPYPLDHPENSIRRRAVDAGYNVTHSISSKEVKVFTKQN